MKRQKYHIFEGKLRANFTALSIAQGLNFITPLLIVPYMIRTVGLENYGKLTLAQGIMTYLVMIVDYGFNIGATREVAQNPNAPKKLSRIFSKIMVAKLSLSVLCFGILLIVMAVSEPIKTEYFLYLASFVMVLGHAVLPNWIFQGIEKMNYIAAINLISKILYIALVFVFIRTAGGYVFLLLFYGVGTFIGSVYGLIVLSRKFNIKISASVSPKEVISALRTNWDLFGTNALSSLITGSGVIILSFFAGAKTLGLFGVVERIYLALRQVVVILYNSLLPRVIQTAQFEKQRMKLLFKTYFRSILLLFLPALLLCFIFSPLIARFFLGYNEPAISIAIRIIIFAPFLAALNIIPSHFLIALKKDRILFQATWIIAFVYLLVAILITRAYGFFGITTAILIGEAIFLMGYFYVAGKNGYWSLSDQSYSM